MLTLEPLIDTHAWMTHRTTRSLPPILECTLRMDCYTTRVLPDIAIALHVASCIVKIVVSSV